MNRYYELKDKRKYCIREAVPEDAQKFFDYQNTIAGESDNLTFGPGELMISVEDERNIIEKAVNAKNQYFIVAELGDEIIGNLHFLSGRRLRISHAGNFGISVQKKYWGNGIAYELITSLIEWSKNGKIITKINLQVREDNERAIKLYKKFGFREEGLNLRSFLIDGRYYNTYYMGLILD